MKQKLLSMTDEEVISLVESIMESKGPILVEKVTAEDDCLVVIYTELLQNLGIFFSGFSTFDSRKKTTARLQIPEDENGTWIIE